MVQFESLGRPTVSYSPSMVTMAVSFQFVTFCQIGCGSLDRVAQSGSAAEIHEWKIMIDYILDGKLKIQD